MTKPGRRNLITDVAGLHVGQAEDARACTGVTVLVADKAVSAAVDVRGGAPGTRETEALDPVSLGGVIDAITLSGGSVYGLDAASGVMAWLGARGRGFRFAPGTPSAPIVPGAIIFDLANGGEQRLGRDAALSRAGARRGRSRPARISRSAMRGAGFGARAGLYKGGTGSARR